MSLQFLSEAPEHRTSKGLKPVSDDSPTLFLIPTRSNTPENEKNYDNYSDKDSTVESLTPTTRLLSSSSISSVDFSDANFEIE